MLSQDTNINKLINENIISQGYMMINIEGESGENTENMLAFTVGIYAKYGMPEILLIGEKPESIIDMLKIVISNFSCGLTIEESINIAELDGETLKLAELSDEIKQMLAPQIKSYYDEYLPDMSDIPVSWVGKTSMAYPFEYFLTPESERPKGMQMITDSTVN